MRWNTLPFCFVKCCPVAGRGHLALDCICHPKKIALFLTSTFWTYFSSTWRFVSDKQSVILDFFYLFSMEIHVNMSPGSAPERTHKHTHTPRKRSENRLLCPITAPDVSSIIWPDWVLWWSRIPSVLVELSWWDKHHFFHPTSAKTANTFCFKIVDSIFTSTFVLRHKISDILFVCLSLPKLNVMLLGRHREKEAAAFMEIVAPKKRRHTD